MNIDVGFIPGVSLGLEFPSRDLFDEEDFECSFGMILDLLIIRLVITM